MTTTTTTTMATGVDDDDDDDDNDDDDDDGDVGAVTKNSTFLSITRLANSFTKINRQPPTTPQFKIESILYIIWVKILII